MLIDKDKEAIKYHIDEAVSAATALATTLNPVQLKLFMQYQSHLDNALGILKKQVKELVESND